MDSTRRINLLWRWSAAIGAITAIVWLVWYLITGEVPSVYSVKITKEVTWELPFGISRLWDIPFAGIWTLLLVGLFTSPRIMESNDSDFLGGFCGGLVGGLLAGSIAICKGGLGVGLGYGLGVVLGLGLSLGLVAGLVYLLKLIP